MNIYKWKGGEIMKCCSKCMKLKELCQFAKDRNKKDGFSSHCKACKKQNDAIRYKDRELSEKDKEKRNYEYFENRLKMKLRNGCEKCSEKNSLCITLGSPHKNMIEPIEKLYKTRQYMMIVPMLDKVYSVCYNCCKKNKMIWVELSEKS